MTAEAAPAGVPPLRFTTKLSYGLGSIAHGWSGAGLSGGVLQLFFNQVMGLPSIWVGTVILLSLAADAIVDPIVGRMSDRTRTRLGRRHPYMYAAAVPAAGFFWLLWHLPAGLSKLALAALALALMALVRICVSIYEIPSNALTPELSADYDSRTTLQSFRWFFGIIGGALAAYLLNGVFLGGHAQGQLYRAGYGQWASISALVILVFILLSTFGTQGRVKWLPTSPKPERQSFGKSLREVRGTVFNRSLVALMSSGFLGGCANGVTINLSIYMYLHYWNLGPKQYGILVPAGAIGSMLAVFLAPFLARRMGKKRAMMSLFFASVAVGAGPVFLRLVGVMPPNGSPWIMPILIADGIVTATLGIVGFIIAGSMAADVVEDSAVRTGVRSEGLVYAAFGLLFKFTAGVGAFIASVLLTVVHFPAHASRGSVDPQLMRHLVMLYLPMTILLNIAAISLLGFYRIDKRAHERNVEALASRGFVHPEKDLAGEGPAPVTPGV